MSYCIRWSNCALTKCRCRLILCYAGAIVFVQQIEIYAIDYNAVRSRNAKYFKLKRNQHQHGVRVCNTNGTVCFNLVYIYSANRNAKPAEVAEVLRRDYILLVRQYAKFFLIYQSHAAFGDCKPAFANAPIDFNDVSSMNIHLWKNTPPRLGGLTYCVRYVIILSI